MPARTDPASGGVFLNRGFPARRLRGDGSRDAAEDPFDHLAVVEPGNTARRSRAFARDAKAAKINGSLHTLRHSYISHLVRAGVAPRTVQLYAGHAHLATTEKYLYLAPGITPTQALRLAL